MQAPSLTPYMRTSTAHWARWQVSQRLPHLTAYEVSEVDAEVRATRTEIR
jgi:hypothetical protein